MCSLGGKGAQPRLDYNISQLETETANQSHRDQHQEGLIAQESYMYDRVKEFGPSRAAFFHQFFIHLNTQRSQIATSRYQ